MSTVDFPADLIALERTAWEATQAGTLTPQQAAAVQARVTEYAAEAGLNRYEVEMRLKRTVRHPEA